MLLKSPHTEVSIKKSSIKKLSIKKSCIKKSSIKKSSIKKASIKKSSIKKSSIKKSSIEKSKFKSRESIKSAMLHTSLMYFFIPSLSARRSADFLKFLQRHPLWYLEN